MKRLGILLLLGTLALTAQEEQSAGQSADSPFPLSSEHVSGSLDVGNRWITDVGGNFNTYRSVVNLGEGPKLFGADLLLEDPESHVFDTFIFTADHWGGEPYNTARIDAQRDESYRIIFDYRNLAYFNFLPSFANPTLGDGILVNQRSFDTQRRVINTELEIFPGKQIVPYVGYVRNSGRGTGITPFVTQGNEFPVRNNLDDKTDNYRGGVRFEMKRWHLTLEQGGTTFKDDQHVYTDELNLGNRTTPILGNETVLEQLDQIYRVRGDSLYTRALFTAAPISWMDLSGQFLFSQPTTDVTYTENAQGLFYLGATRFFNGSASGLMGGAAKQPHSAGSFSVELRPHHRVRVIETWMTDRLHNASSALFESTLVDYLVGDTDTLRFSADRLVMNYNRQQAEVFVDVTKRLTLRGGHRYEWGHSEVRPATLNFAETPERGELKRHVLLAGGNYRASSRLSLNASYEAADGDRTYFRTSLQDYQRLRVRSRFQILPSLEMTAGVRYFDNENPTEGVNYDFRTFSAIGSVRWRPGGGKYFSILTEYSWSSIKSDILFRNPAGSNSIASSYRDLGHAATTVADITLPTGSSAIQPRLSVGGSLFVSSGSRPTDYYQPLARFTVPIHGNVGVYAEWKWFGLSQSAYAFESFRTHHLVTGLEFSL